MPSIFPKIVLSGSPKTCGVTYGQAAAEKISACINMYKTIFSAHGFSWEKSVEYSRKHLPFIEVHFPALIEEMEGIAQGAQVSFDSILAINCRSELLFSASLLDGCTALGVTSEATGEGKPYIAQTWDWCLASRDLSIVLEIQQPSLPTILAVVEAGMVGGKGINSAGIGVCLNAMNTGSGGLGIPVHILYRGILNAYTLPGAIEMVACLPRAGAGNFTIGADSDQAIYIEFSPDNYDLVYAEEGFIAHTNHYLSSLLADKDQMKFTSSDTYTRLGRARKLLKQHFGRVTKAKMIEILSDHLNFPNGICSHKDKIKLDSMKIRTVYAIILDLREKTLWLSNGNPCEADFCPFYLKPGGEIPFVGKQST